MAGKGRERGGRRVAVDITARGLLFGKMMRL